MENTQEDRQRIVSIGERSVRPENSLEQLVPPKDERIFSTNPYPDAATTGSSSDHAAHSRPSNGAGDLSVYTQDLNIPYAGYGNTAGGWDGYSQFFNNDGFPMSPAIYSETPSVYLPSGFGYTPEMAYGQYSPVGNPLHSMMVEGQLYSPQQIPFSPTYYPQHAPSNVAISPSEFMTPESRNDSLLYGPGPTGYMVPFGSFGGGNISGDPSPSPFAAAAYPQTMGILGSYEHNMEQRPIHGYGSSSSSSMHYPYGGSYQRSNYSSATFPYSGANDQTKYTLEKGRRWERPHESIYTSHDSHSVDRNRGPRASKINTKSSVEQSMSVPSVNSKNGSAKSENNLDVYNRPDFVTEYENGKFFIIKSFSEDNVHKSIKYDVWASTANGNKKLDAAYCEAKEMKGNCPVFLFFSVNGSGQFCGVAEMVGHVDFDKDADHWQQDRWSGQFPVKWHILKDVPNNQFRHILLENNENKPVTHSRDTQEVKLEQGVQMLKIFKDHEAQMSILDDFEFYDERERVLKERKARQPANSTTDAISVDSIYQMANNLAQTLRLHGDSVDKSSGSAIPEPTNQTADTTSETKIEPVE